MKSVSSWLAFLLVAAACSTDASSPAQVSPTPASSSTTAPTEPTIPDAVDPGPTARADGGSPLADKASACASTFGTELTNAYGRFDGTIVAVVPPAHPTCALPNRDHLVLQVASKGSVYRMVVNVLSKGDDPDVRFAAVEHALTAPAWSEGWHTDSAISYVGDLDLHQDGSTLKPLAMDALVQRVTSLLNVGAKVSVYSTSSGGASAHLVHRNANGDGAIVVDPDGTRPLYLAFAFSDQTF